MAAPNSASPTKVQNVVPQYDAFSSAKYLKATEPSAMMNVAAIIRPSNCALNVCRKARGRTDAVSAPATINPMPTNWSGASVSSRRRYASRVVKITES